ncbi:MAG: ATP phosphoribosyltransferase regulatory subunit [Gammaproteobacteria bacterium]
MNTRDRWLLPEGVDEVLPPQAAALEQLCRQVVDLHACWGYELVFPPLIEFLDSLLTGTGSDLDLQTFKLTDQLTGRLMGLRADMTPQVARIDAHKLGREGISRLSYLGTVLHTRPSAFGDSRCPLQVGAELYGHSGIESDAEVMCLLLETLLLVGINKPYIDIGHMRIVQALIAAADLNDMQRQQLFDILDRKATAELNALLNDWQLTPALQKALSALPTLNGSADILAGARSALAAVGEPVKTALDDLQRILDIVGSRYPQATFYIDLAELRGYHYHTGIVFAAYIDGQGSGLAFGGRYDDIGRAFGRARPATGFSVDLKRLLAQLPAPTESVNGILAPWSENDKTLQALVSSLRQQGERVVQVLPDGNNDPALLGCNRRIVEQSGQWQVKSV